MSNLKVLYVTSKGGIHDYRFVKKLAGDYRLMLLHYAASELIDEIKSIPNIEIISRKPLVKSFPLATQLGHLKRIYRKFKPDIVHTGYVWQVGILASMLNLHPHLSMAWGSDILIEPDKNFFVKMLVKKVINQCDHIQCDAEFVKQKIIRDYGAGQEKISVFPWGIDRSIFKPADKTECRKQLHLNENKFIVIFNRYLEPVYGVKDMLRGFAAFAEGKDDVLLIVVSGGSMKSEVIKFIHDRGLEAKINFIGRVPNKQLPLFLNAADVYISVSFSDGTSLSLLEAMACGLGLIVTDLPAIMEWVSNENGIAVPTGSPDKIADALQEYYSRRELTEKHGKENIRIAGDRADWDKNYLKLQEIYHKLLDNPRRGNSRIDPENDRPD